MTLSMPALLQQRAEQQAGRAGADDGDLGAHGCLLRVPLTRRTSGAA